MGKKTISKKVKATRRHGLSTYSDNGRDRRRRTTNVSDPRQLSLFNRVQESGKVQEPVYDYEPSGGSCYGLTADSVLEDE